MLLLETKETFNENECHMDLTKKKKSLFTVILLGSIVTTHFDS